MRRGADRAAARTGVAGGAFLLGCGAPLSHVVGVVDGNRIGSDVAPSWPVEPTTDPLPGLSKYVSNATLYFERWGFSARVSRRTRSSFIGEFEGFGGDRERHALAGEKVVDAQIGYSFQSGPLQNLSITFQVNNLTNEPSRQTVAGYDDRFSDYFEYGRTYMLGASYKF